MQNTNPETTYTQRRAMFDQQRTQYARLSGRAANRNLVLFVAALICLALGLGQAGPLLLVVAAVLAVAFVASFVIHGRTDRLQRRFDTLWSLSDAGMRRLQRDWAGLTLREAAPADSTHPYAADLDLFGPASLLHLLSTASSPAGQATLRNWLLAPAPAPTIVWRQGAVAELAPQIDLRDELALRGQLVGASQPAYERFRRWAEQEPWLRQRTWLLWAARVLPLITLALALVQLFGFTELPLWLLPFAATTLLSYSLAREANAIIDEVAERQETFRAYAELFALIESQSWQADELRRIQDDLSAGQLQADQQLRRLGALMPLADVRGWMFFLPIQLLTLWNIHLLWLLERWRARAGSSVGRWLDALGELEALAALAALRHDHPDWCFPQMDRAAASLEARGLGHPLLPDENRVGNDVSVGPAGSFLLITGSNMSGKSTLLRAIGLNAVLAQTGAPVCALELRMPPLAIATSMRVQDSLAQGVSFFLAELRRLKLVVDLAHAAQANGGPSLLFLLDEILQGTNTADRQVAARRVIRHLLALGATGAVSTHDLTLADAPDLAAISRRFYLTEQVSRGPDGPHMTFDYQLRPGVATSTNALTLMELVGLPSDA